MAAAKKSPAKRAPAKAVPKANPVGRPTDYDPRFVGEVEKLCALGAIDREIAAFFKVSVATLNTWKKKYPEFLASTEKAKAEADSLVERRLFERATGYEHPEVHVSNYQGAITLTPLTKRYAPDTTAGIFWLKNRRSADWRDRSEVEHSGILGFAEKLVRARERAKRS